MNNYNPVKSEWTLYKKLVFISEVLLILFYLQAHA